jgi:glycosyltransferase involved in cell wall biosynthesis
MRIGINASFLRKPGTGIGQVTWHFLQTLKDLPEAKEHQFFLYTDTAYEGAPWSENFQVRTLTSWWKRDDELRKYVFETKSLPQALTDDMCDVLLSLYQSATIATDVQHLVVVHDIIPEIFPAYRRTFRKKFFWAEIKKALSQAEAYIAVSRHTKEDMVKYLGIDQHKITIYQPSVDPLFEVSLTRNIHLPWWGTGGAQEH